MTGVLTCVFFFFNDTATTEIYTLSLHDALPISYPAGMDVQVFALKVLKEVSQTTKDLEEREHCSWLIYRDPKTTKYKLLNVKGPKDLFYPHLRLMLDYPEDYEFIAKIYENLYQEKPGFNTLDIIKLLEEKPELKKINEELDIKVWAGQKIDESTNGDPKNEI